MKEGTILKQGTGYTIQLLDAVPAIQVSFDQNEPITHEAFREHGHALLDLFRAHSSQHDKLGVLIDARELKALDPDDISWIADVVTKGLADMGVAFIYHVLPADVFAQLNVENYAEEVAPRFAFPQQHFLAVDEAIDTARALLSARAS